jgi:nucleoside-diphosphate-sugar epimerase
MTKKVLILGCNGFIGSNLIQTIATTTDWQVYGMDFATDKITEFLNHPAIHFTEGDITINKEWVNYHIKKCDVVLPLAAIATPATYVTNPLRVFELDFEANLEIVRKCLFYKKRVVFPSTSEVYGMSPDNEFNEETSPLMQGPINKERWIYSSCKQLLDRVIYAYGKHHGLQFTLFRPFNWIGPKLDDIHNIKAGGSRVITQFLCNIINNQDLQLVDGGEQKRCFTFIDDGITALIKIIANDGNVADSQIFNIGNPNNNASIREIAEKLLVIAKKYPKYKNTLTKIVNISSAEYYGKGYQDVQNRIPAVKRAKDILGWTPTTDLDTALQKTAQYYLS